MSKRYDGTLQLALCLLAVVMGSLSLLTFGIYSPHFVTAFDASVATVSIAASVVLLGADIAAPIVGRLLDIYTVKQVYLAGAAFFLAGLLGISLAHSATALLLSCALVGIGFSVLGPFVALSLIVGVLAKSLGEPREVAYPEP